MKKVILSLSGILIAAFVIVLVANGQNTRQDVKKAATEQKADCAKCPSSTACGTMADTKKTDAKTCDPAKCKEKGCDPAKCKEGKCDPATCKTDCKSAGADMKKCDPAKCTGMAKK